jgi:hypothetical protein
MMGKGERWKMKACSAFKRLRVPLLVLLLLLALVPTAFAFDGREGEEVIIGADEVVEDDLYVSASTFVLDGTVKGDLYVMGQNITVNGLVEGDLVSAAQVVLINGQVLGAARIGGGALVLGEGASVGMDLVAAGASLEAQQGSTIRASLVFMGYQASLSGTIAQDVRMSGNGLAIRGSVGGDVEADVGSSEAQGVNPMQFMPNMPSMPSVPGGLTITESAEIGGDLTYASPQEANIPSGVVQGEVNYTQDVGEQAQPEKTTVQRVGGWFGRNTRRLIALLIVGLLLAWLAPSWITRAADAMEESPWLSLGLGVATLFGFPMAMFLLVVAVVVVAFVLYLVTLGNLGNAVVWVGIAVVILLSVVFGLVITYVAKIVAGYWGGRFLLKRVNPEWAEKPIWSVLLGVVIVAILISIPFIGWLLGWIITLFGLGPLWRLGGKGRRSMGDTVVVKSDA